MIKVRQTRALGFGTLILALGLGAAACGSSTTPSTTNNNNTAKALFTAQLSPANEVPAFNNAESTGSGTMTITFNLTKDAAGNVTAATADFSGTFTGFPAGTTLTAAHIHPGVAGTNGSPLVNLALSQGEITFATGSGSLNKTNITMTTDQANSIMNSAGSFYFNIHTALNPGGVARGQLVRTQ
jgi:hypothetical protein